jgi:hypothetical protein
VTEFVIWTKYPVQAIINLWIGKVLLMSVQTSFTKALVSIDWISDAPPPILRCPISGQVIAAGYDPSNGETADDYVEPNWEAIPTVLFHYIPEIGEFDFIRPELQSKIDSVRERLGDQADDLDDFEILEAHVEKIGNVPLIFHLITSGMACGPVSSSIYVGLDLAAAYPQE